LTTIRFTRFGGSIPRLGSQTLPRPRADLSGPSRARRAAF
jgi:hypothetical protein